MSSHQDSNPTVRIGPPSGPSSTSPLRSTTTPPVRSAADSGSISSEHPFNEAALPDRFVFKGALGEGGFGLVVLAWDSQLLEDVAIKMPRPDILLTRAVVKRFLREAQNVVKLDHHNIVRLLGTGEQAGLPYIVYHYCEGPTLARWLSDQSRPIAPKTAARIGWLLAEGMQHAHTRGILHRDLKPSNILLENGGANDAPYGFLDRDRVRIPRITDFGISKALLKSGNDTLTSSTFGTVEYMAPEQLLERSQDIGSYTDVFAIGLILFEMVTGIRPFHGMTLSERIAQLKHYRALSSKKLIPSIPYDLDAILQKCMEYSEHDRYSTASELAKDLASFLDNRPIEARPPSLASRTLKWARRQPQLASVMLLCFVLLVTTFGIAIRNWQKEHFLNQTLRNTNASLELAVNKAAVERDRANAITKELQFEKYSETLRESYQALQANDLWNYHHHLIRIKNSPFALNGSDLAWSSLWSMGHLPSQSKQLSANPVYHIQLSKDGSNLLCCGADQSIHIVSRDDLQILQSWNAKQGEVNCAHYSPDESLVASAGDDGSVCVWNTYGRLLNRFQAHQDTVFHLEFLDEDTLVTCGIDPIVRKWNWREGTELAQYVAHRKTVHALLPDRVHQQFITGSDDGTRNLWPYSSDPRPGPARTLAVEPYARTCRMALVPEQDAILVSDAVGQLFYESLDGRTNFPLAKLQDGFIESLAISPNRRWYAIGTREGIIELGEFKENGKPLPLNPSRQDRRWFAHDDRVYDLTFSADGQCLFSVSADGSLKSWDLSHLERSRTLHFPPSENLFKKLVFFSETSPHDCFLGVDRRIYRSNATNHSLELCHETEKHIGSMAAAPTYDLVFLIEGDRRIAAYHASQTPWSIAWSHELNPIAEGAADQGLAYNPVANEVAGTFRGTAAGIMRYHAVTGKPLQTFAFPEGIGGECEGGIFYSDNGRYLAAARGRWCVVWDLIHDSAFIIDTPNTVQAVTFHPSSNWIATISADRSIRVWDLDQRKLLQDWKQNGSQPHDAEFSSDGSKLITSDQQGKVAIWSVPNWQLLLEFGPFSGPITLPPRWNHNHRFYRIGSSEIREGLLVP